MGRRDGDTLTLSNAWASITITRKCAFSEESITYTMTGDIDMQRVWTLKEALRLAWTALANFEHGRCD